MAKPGIELPVQFTKLGWHATSDAHKPNAGRRRWRVSNASGETITSAGDDAALRRSRKHTRDKRMFASSLMQRNRMIANQRTAQQKEW